MRCLCAAPDLRSRRRRGRETLAEQVAETAGSGSPRPLLWQGPPLVVARSPDPPPLRATGGLPTRRRGARPPVAETAGRETLAEQLAETAGRRSSPLVVAGSPPCCGRSPTCHSGRPEVSRRVRRGRRRDLRSRETAGSGDPCDRSRRRRGRETLAEQLAETAGSDFPADGSRGLPWSLTSFPEAGRRRVRDSYSASSRHHESRLPSALRIASQSAGAGVVHLAVLQSVSGPPCRCWCARLVSSVKESPSRSRSTRSAASSSDSAGSGATTSTRK